MTDDSATIETMVVNFGIGEAIESAVRRSEDWSLALTVTDDAEVRSAAEGLRNISDVAKRIEQARTTRKAPLLEASGRLDGTFKPILERLKSVEQATKQKVSTYQAAQAARLREAARAAQQAADEERSRQRAIAEEARKANDIEAAANATFAAEMAVAPPTPKPAKVTGLVETSRWHAEVEDLGLLIIACANDPERYPGLLEANQPALNKIAVAHHGAVQVPGVRMIEVKSVAVR